MVSWNVWFLEFKRPYVSHTFPSRHTRGTMRKISSFEFRAEISFNRWPNDTHAKALADVEEPLLGSETPKSPSPEPLSPKGAGPVRPTLRRFEKSQHFRAFHQVRLGFPKACNMREELKEVFYQWLQKPGRSARTALEIPPIERACNSESESMSKFCSESSWARR